MQESNAPGPNRRGGVRPGAGRPRRAPTLAGALREAFPVERLVRIAEDMIASESDEVRFRTLMQIFDRCHGKVSDKLEIGPPGTLTDVDEDTLADQLTLDELDALDRLDEQRAKILDVARQRVPDPLGSDEEVLLLPAGVAPIPAK